MITTKDGSLLIDTVPTKPAVKPVAFSGDVEAAFKQAGYSIARRMAVGFALAGTRPILSGTEISNIDVAIRTIEETLYDTVFPDGEILTKALCVMESVKDGNPMLVNTIHSVGGSDVIGPWCDGGEDSVHQARRDWIISAFRPDITIVIRMNSGEMAAMRMEYCSIMDEIRVAAKNEAWNKLESLKVELKEILGKAFAIWEADVEAKLYGLESIEELKLAHDIALNKREKLEVDRPIWAVVKAGSKNHLEEVCKDIREEFRRTLRPKKLEEDPLAILFE